MTTKNNDQSLGRNILETPNEIPDSSTNDKFHKHVCVNGTMLNAYIDFGSECSLIRYSDAKALGLPECNSRLLTIRGFGNSVVVPKFQSRVHIKIDELETDITVLAVHDAYLNMPMLIEQNFTEIPTVTVMKDNERLVFYHNPSVVSDDTVSTLDVFVTRDVDIRKGGLAKVCTKEPYSGDVYVDGSTRMYPNQEYYLHQGCYAINDSKALIFVSALTNSPLSFKAGSLIGRVSLIATMNTFLVQTE